MTTRFWISRLCSGVAASALMIAPASATLIFEDTFEIGGDSANTGFGPDGVNTNVPARWDGASAVVNEPNLGWFRFATNKPDSAYSIVGDALDVAVAPNPGRLALSNNGGAGGSAFNFASLLGSGGEAQYRVEVTMGLDVDATNGARTSFMWGDNAGVNDSDVALQLRDSGNDLEVFIRIDSSNHSGGDLNQLIGVLSGRAGELVDFDIDFVDRGDGIGNESDFLITAQSGSESFSVSDTDVIADDSWRFSGTFRTVALDTAPNEGATYDNIRITIPEPGALAVAAMGLLGVLTHAGRGPRRS